MVAEIENSESSQNQSTSGQSPAEGELLQMPKPGPERLRFKQELELGNLRIVPEKPGYFRRVSAEEKEQLRAKREADQRDRDAEFRKREEQRLKLVDLMSCQRRWEWSNVPQRYWDLSFNTLEEPKGKNANKFVPTVETCTAMLRNAAINALIGPRGTGKTAIATCLCREFAALGKSSYCSTAQALFRDIRKNWGERGGNSNEDKFLRRLQSVDLLVFDEVQVRSESAWENNVLVDLIDTRYGELRSTLLISNLDQRGFAESLGDSICSRMMETGTVLICDWPTWRTPRKIQPNRQDQRYDDGKAKWTPVVNETLLVEHLKKSKVEYDLGF